jgi:murein DD-endopeptidase MepM/ murein hydrolase activator NlpD
MRLFPGLQVSPSALRLVTASVAVMLLAGCSSDSTRLAGIGIGGDSSADLTPTASIPSNSGGRPQTYAGVSTTAVQSQPLAPIASRPLSPPNPSFTAPAVSSPHLKQTASLAPATTASTLRPVSGWSAEGGTPVTVAQGESAAVLASRYGVPTDALLRSNGFSSASQVQPGTRLVIPVYSSASAGVAAKAAAPVREIATAKPIETKTREHLRLAQGAQPAAVQASAPVGKTVAARPGHPAATALTTEGKSGKPAATALKPGAKQVDAKEAAAKQTEQEARKATLEAKKAEADAKKQAALDAKKAALDAKKAAADAKTAAAVDRETTTASVPAAAAAPAAHAADADKPEFRWPARGRVIQGFKAGANDGINIALPEGTSVKAAEAGVVAYAGSELKGYGNLVLIRHPNGYVSAYANNGEISVKRGDQVKRGQIIAKSGQSGNVNAPQLHFELRKGSTPVDPSGYLAGTL